ncbi:hypothetical protein B0H14DRAFT_2612330 [Mycena olivaceomarginata]|nr:hypothetical protein B0H14DRAFT_2612330 [Mycena olivaceomarginata]
MEGGILQNVAEGTLGSCRISQKPHNLNITAKEAIKCLQSRERGVCQLFKKCNAPGPQRDLFSEVFRDCTTSQSKCQKSDGGETSEGGASTLKFKGEKGPDLAHRPNALWPSNVAFMNQFIWQMAAYGRAELGSKNDTLNSSHLTSSKLWISSRDNEKAVKIGALKPLPKGSGNRRYKAGKADERQGPLPVLGVLNDSSSH